MTTKKIAAIERLTNTAAGNPRHNIDFTDGSFGITDSDSSFAYSVGNLGMREGDTVNVEFRKNTITSMEST